MLCRSTSLPPTKVGLVFVLGLTLTTLQAMARFLKGPPGGLHLPPAKVRLSDAEGGVFGSGASVASTGVNAKSAHASHHTFHTPTTQQEWDDVLEFYNFHADRGSADFMFRLGRIYYQGFGSLGAIKRKSGTQAAASEHELGGRDYARALKWFHRIARAVWNVDPQKAIRKPLTAGTATIGSYDATKDAKLAKDEHLTMVAGLSAGYLGKMHLRGEGVKQDFAKAFLWFNRGASHASGFTLCVTLADGQNRATTSP
jgi:SEL1 protein